MNLVSLGIIIMTLSAPMNLLVLGNYVCELVPGCPLKQPMNIPFELSVPFAGMFILGFYFTMATRDDKPELDSEDMAEEGDQT